MLVSSRGPVDNLARARGFATLLLTLRSPSASLARADHIMTRLSEGMFYTKYMNVSVCAVLQRILSGVAPLAC